MTVDNVTIAWVLILVGFRFMGTMIAFMYYADKASKKFSKKSSKK